MVGFTLNMAFAKLKRRRVERDRPAGGARRAAPNPLHSRAAARRALPSSLPASASLLHCCETAGRSARRWLGRE